MQQNKLLWGLAAGTYGVADTLTTYINLLSGFRELNPLINMYSIVPVKILILFLLYLVSKRINDKGAIPFLLLMLGLISSYHNISLWI